jgi:hypothetical protein
MNLKQYAEQMIEATRDFVSRALQPLETRLSALEARQPERGEKGADGNDGQSGCNGADGKDGAPGRDGVDGKDGRDGVDGKSVTLDEVRAYLDEFHSSWELGFERRGQELLQRAIANIPAGPAGTDGRDGEPGRDAAQIDVLPSIDPTRRYQRGTYATHAGGLVRAFRATDPLNQNLDACGWQVVVNGIDAIDVEQTGERSFAVSMKMTRGVSSSQFTQPLMIYRDVFREGVDYVKGDCVTFGGSLWHAQNDHPVGKPGASPDWRLAVKKGRDGSDK